MQLKSVEFTYVRLDWLNLLTEFQFASQSELNWSNFACLCASLENNSTTRLPKQLHLNQLVIECGASSGRLTSR
jgi:hypothetical protein